MAISDEDIQKVREAVDLVALFGERVPVRQRGRDYWCCCPFHNEKTPSCKIDPARQVWHCFGCGEGGDAFGFVMKMDDVSFPDAVRTLADRYRIDIADDGKGRVSTSRKARLRDVCAETCAFYHAQLMRGKSPDADAARAYLSGRGLGGRVPATWTLGFAPGRGALVRHLRAKGFTHDEMVEANVAVKRDNGSVSDRFYNRVMFPIRDPQGECIAFGGRVIGEGEPKYLNSQETPLFHKSSVLYGLDKAKASMTTSGTAIIVEGYTDVIALHESGIGNAVATLGTALTLQHIRIISRHASKRIVYLFDGDAAGQRAADRALGFIDESMTPEAGKARIELCAVTLPDDLDPADFVAQRGADALRALVQDAKPLIAYGIDRRLAVHDLESPEGRTRAMADALSVLAPIKGSMLAKDYAVQLAGRLRMREQDALDALAALAVPRVYDRQDASRQNQQAAAPEDAVALSSAERSRRRFERRFVSLLAQNPSLALRHADSLAQTQWHDATNGQLAECLLSTLESNPAATAAEIVARASQMAPRAAGAMTSAATAEGEDLESTVRFLVEELEIGDMESTLVGMNAQLKSDSALSPEEREMVFAAIVDLQKAVAAKRAAHKPVVQ
ncbi:MAG TPA: DNA primase [Eggerthellaceae bacterium]|nr:DNA primase [Eggerthellaceae bacterium]